MKYRVLVPLVALAALFAARTAQAGEKDVLDPTPARTPADVEQVMQEHGIPEVELEEDARAPEERSEVGALTGLEGGRIGFMPLLQHHMGVEHWFVEGLTKANLGRWPAQGERFLVRLRGRVSLERQWSPFGGGTGFYGNGLPHGEVYGGPGGGVMGYHESVYRLVVDEVVWVRTRAEFAALGTEFRTRQQAVERAIQAADWQQALEAHRHARAMHVDLAIDRGVNHPGDMEPALRAFVLLTGDAASWTNEDLDAIAQPFASEFPSDLSKRIGPVLRQAASAWPPEARARLGARLVKVWEGREYRFQKDRLRKGALAIVGGPAVADLEERITRNEVAIASLGARLEAHLAAHEYAEAQAVFDEIAPLQAFLLTYEYGDQRTQHWIPSLERAIALDVSWSDPAKRMEVLEAQIREAVASGADLPNNSYRPRYPRELADYFLPRLPEDEQRQIEALLIGLAENLHPTENWDGSIVAAEMLTGVAGRATAAFLPGFLAKRRSINEWQREYLETYAEAIRKRAE